MFQLQVQGASLGMPFPPGILQETRAHLREVEHGLAHVGDVHLLQVLEGLQCWEGPSSRWV